MTRGIDNSELIDRFLRDELRGEEREIFLRRMETDPAFRLEVESQKLLADAIRLARKNELKRYIAEHAQTRTTRLRPSLVWSLSAAASVAAFAVVWFSWQHYKGNKEQFAMQEVKQEAASDVQGKSENERLQRDRAIARTTPSPTRAEAPPTTIEPMEFQTEDQEPYPAQEANTGVSATPPLEAEGSTIQQYVVATIVVAVADYNTADKELAETESLSRQDIVVTKRVKPASAEGNRSTAGKASSNQAATAQDDATVQKPTVVNRNSTQSNYTLVFINSQDGILKAQAEKGNRILLYNLPYNNPMLITLGGKYYLGTAEQFYSLQPDLPTQQILAPVKDTALLKALQGE